MDGKQEDGKQAAEEAENPASATAGAARQDDAVSLATGSKGSERKGVARKVEPLRKKKDTDVAPGSSAGEVRADASVAVEATAGQETESQKEGGDADPAAGGKAEEEGKPTKEAKKRKKKRGWSSSLISW